MSDIRTGFIVVGKSEGSPGGHRGCRLVVVYGMLPSVGSLVHGVILEFGIHSRELRHRQLRACPRPCSARGQVATRNLPYPHSFLVALNPCASSLRVSNWFILRKNLFSIKKYSCTACWHTPVNSVLGARRTYQAFKVTLNFDVSLRLT